MYYVLRKGVLRNDLNRLLDKISRIGETKIVASKPVPKSLRIILMPVAERRKAV